MLTRGRIPKTMEILSIRELVRDDLQALRAPRAKLGIARFRDPHHRLARLQALGLRQFEIVERSGYSLSRIAVIQADPAFQELVAKYREKVDESFKENADEFHELMTSNMRKAETQLAEKLEEAEEAGELLPTKDLLAIVADRADRVGYGKKETRVNVNVDFAAQLEKALARSAKSKTLDLTPSAVQVSPPTRQVAALSSAPADSLAQPQPFRRRA